LPQSDFVDAAAAEQLLHVNARALFGPRPQDRHVYIMVTAPEAAEATSEWADSLIHAGANLLRINGAHGLPSDWQGIAAIFRERAVVLGVPVRIVVDLPGPKLRVDIRQVESGVIHVRRRKDRQGRTLGPTILQLAAECRGPAEIPIPSDWLPQLHQGDELGLIDTRGRELPLKVIEANARGATAECWQSLYAVSGLPVTWRRGSKLMGRAQLGPVPESAREVRLSKDDCFIVNAQGRSKNPQQVALALPEPGVLSRVAPGDRVILDDGRIVAVAVARRESGLLCRVTATVKPATRLGTGKGIAFPDSDLLLKSLGAEDELALHFALQHADVVGVSFVNSAADVARVAARIQQSGRQGVGLILKLETRTAMHNLPSILFEALKHDPVGLMIARGDLALDVGFGRLAEMQEELLWFGEACHLPVVWATQVLESVAHSGLPTRAEVTDAAMAMRAECVMLNRGPYVAVANRLLADIIRKMEAHQYKKRALFRPLAMAGAEIAPSV
jgi:pyruvate kinase